MTVTVSHTHNIILDKKRNQTKPDRGQTDHGKK